MIGSLSSEVELYGGEGEIEVRGTDGSQREGDKFLFKSGNDSNVVVRIGDQTVDDVQHKTIEIEVYYV